jgi:adenylate cyclase
MERRERINQHALAARVAERLAGPTEAILGFQDLILIELRRSGPSDAIEDAEKVMTAARSLNGMILGLISNDGDRSLAEVNDATLRHDLRTPVNAILGYSELMLEEFDSELGATIQKDIATVVEECRHLLNQLEGLFDFFHGYLGTGAVVEADTGIAEGLHRTLAVNSGLPARSNGQILVVDDIEANRELLRRNLMLRGHSVTAVGSAKDALALLETTVFEIVLIDILMPDMNGIELLARLKADPRWSDMALLIVSGLKDVKAVVRCIEGGATDYLQKPIDPVLLYARVESCLEHVRWRVRERQFVKQIEFEKSRADTLLMSMLPEMVIKRIGVGETVIADRFEGVTVVFADIVDFTPLVARSEPAELVSQLHMLFSTFDDLADLHGIEKIKTIGDAYMAVAGVPVWQPDHAERALDFARNLIATMATGFGDFAPLKIRIGLSSGPVIAGLIGRKRSVYDVWGETVNLASRLESSGQAGRIQISQATVNALGGTVPGAEVQDRVIKGVGLIRTFMID